MSGEKKSPSKNSRILESPLSPKLALQLTNEEVDDALNFDIDFDAVAESMININDLPNLNGDLGLGMGAFTGGSMGTRSPSPDFDDTASLTSTGSKRSRAEYDGDDGGDDTKQEHGSSKRRASFTASRGGLTMGVNNTDQHQPQARGKSGGDSHATAIRADREREGRCPDCGLETHTMVRKENGFVKEPLTIEGEVLNGRCLFCNPVGEGENINTKRASTRRGMSGDANIDAELSMGRTTPMQNSRQGMMGMATPYQTPQQQQRQTVRHPGSRTGSSDGMMISPQQSMGGMSLSSPVPTPSQSKMALARQRKLPRKHSPKQHAELVFGGVGGSTGYSNLERNTSSGVESSDSHFPNIGVSNDRNYQVPRNSSGISTSSSVSKSEGGDGNSVSNNTVDCDDASRASRNSQFSDGMGRLGQAMAMGMGMNCKDTMTPRGSQQQRQSPFPSQRPSPLSGGSPVPPFVPGQQGQGVKNVASDTDIKTTSSMNSMSSMPSRAGDIPPHVRVAHSKLPSSIYHHHQYPMSSETEQAYMDKTWTYLESGGGDICDILVAMRRFPFSLPIQSIACEKLYVACFDRDHAHAIGLVGGIRTIIDAMEHHSKDVALQRGCAGIIKHLALASPYNLDMLDRMGAVAIIVGAMERNPQSAPLLESCCWALESMARGSNPELKMRVAKGGGIHASMKAVETFPNNESLLRAAFHCLRQMGYNPSSYSGGSQQNQQNQQQQQNNNFMQGGGGSIGSSGQGHGGGGGGGMQRGMMMSNQQLMMNQQMMANNISPAMMGGNNNPMAMMGNGGLNPMMGNNPMLGNTNPMMNNMKMGGNKMNRRM